LHFSILSAIKGRIQKLFFLEEDKREGEEDDEKCAATMVEQNS
jgi:hypothetical protein